MRGSKTSDLDGKLVCKQALALRFLITYGLVDKPISFYKGCSLRLSKCECSKPSIWLSASSTWRAGAGAAILDHKRYW